MDNRTKIPISIAPKRKKVYSNSMIKCSWAMSLRTACFVLGFWLLSPGLFSQEAADIHLVPDILRRPDRAEAPRYPRDQIIGELGQGSAPYEAYSLAQNALLALQAGNRNAAALANLGPAFLESLFEEIAGIRARTYRLGGGRHELDGSISFLLRFIGLRKAFRGSYLYAWNMECGCWTILSLRRNVRFLK